jgi:hypothetical protein
MSFQDELNRINKTSNLSVRDCLVSLASGDDNQSTNELANTYCETTNQTIQDAFNSKAGRDLTTQELLSKQDAAKLIATPE